MMGKRGPAPKPTRLKVIEGNKGKRAINYREPKPRLGIPSCPRFLDKEAKREWRRIVPELHRLDLLAPIDRAALAAYCQSWSDWIDARLKINIAGYYVDGSRATSKRKHYVLAPWTRAANEALIQLKAYLCEFGLTPSSRTRLEVKKDEEKSLEEMLA